ncbi:MAG: gliding motility-associated C-terminal domain-containing protein [Pedobacter sp.]|nr:MAG: gliding motility-associated C-terminal domain-containing protein [Pedobacter sp.]
MLGFLYSNAQVCEGSLGDPVVNIDFGRGGGRGPRPDIITSYNFIPFGSVNGEGDFTIAQSTTGLNGGWYDIFNHTPNDFGGYMMIVNAAPDPGVFYESSNPIDLCPNTTYEFAAWIVNLLRTDGIRPNVTFNVLDANNISLGTFSTGDMPNGNPTWKQYGFQFRTTGAGRVKIRMTNNAPGGAGNDLALDDITFRACGPKITSGINNTLSNTRNLCERANETIIFSAGVTGSSTLKYQWQLNEGTNWIDINGETNPSMSYTFTNALPGVYKFRLAVAEPANFASPLCRTVSPTLTVNVNKYPVPKAISNLPCLGNDLILDVADATGTYKWFDPQGREISELKSPILKNATFAMIGKYKVIVTSGGCAASSEVDVNVISPPDAKVESPLVEVCEGSAIELKASGGTIYTWTPGNGLSAANISNPMASPLQTTTYTVRISNGSCDALLQVKVVVNKKPVANAGEDQKIILGGSTVLNGTASGDQVSYFWTPAAGLDDPLKLNPVASPVESTNYTLNVVSNLGCVTATDQAFVLVYEKLVIPGSFSPNGDGANDLWNITAIETYIKPKVSIMNRYGELIYETTDYYRKPWNGKYKNADVPVGVYYYLISLGDDSKPLSGSVTLLR